MHCIKFTRNIVNILSLFKIIKIDIISCSLRHVYNHYFHEVLEHRNDQILFRKIQIAKYLEISAIIFSTSCKQADPITLIICENLPTPGTPISSNVATTV